jgi:hypothetical protein
MYSANTKIKYEITNGKVHNLITIAILKKIVVQKLKCFRKFTNACEQRSIKVRRAFSARNSTDSNVQNSDGL